MKNFDEHFQFIENRLEGGIIYIDNNGVCKYLYTDEYPDENTMEIVRYISLNNKKILSNLGYKITNHWISEDSSCGFDIIID